MSSLEWEIAELQAQLDEKRKELRTTLEDKVRLTPLVSIICRKLFLIICIMRQGWMSIDLHIHGLRVADHRSWMLGPRLD